MPKAPRTITTTASPFGPYSSRRPEKVERAASLQEAGKQLFKNPEFSDLKIICEGREFLVNKCVVCTQSDFFYGAVTAGFKESQENVITLHEENPSVIEQMIEFLYTGTYTERSAFAMRELHSTHMKCTTHLHLSHQRYVEEKEKLLLSEATMYENINLIIAGDKYGIKGLKTVALDKFQGQLHGVRHISGLLEYVKAVYGTFVTTKEMVEEDDASEAETDDDANKTEKLSALEEDDSSEAGAPQGKGKAVETEKDEEIEAKDLRNMLCDTIVARFKGMSSAATERIIRSTTKKEGGYRRACLQYPEFAIDMMVAMDGKKSRVTPYDYVGGPSGLGAIHYGAMGEPWEETESEEDMMSDYDGPL